MDESYVGINKNLFFFSNEINTFQTVFILLLEDKFSGQRYFGKGVNLWREFVAYRLLLRQQEYLASLPYRLFFIVRLMFLDVLNQCL